MARGIEAGQEYHDIGVRLIAWIEWQRGVAFMFK